MTSERRRYAREWARRKREAEQAARNRGRTTCAVRHGLYGECGALLVDVVVSGHLVTTCPRCERRRRGVCRDCPRPVAGRVGYAIRCAECREREREAASERYRARHRDALNRRAKMYGRRNRNRRAEYKRRWRLLNPEKVRRQKRRAALRLGGRTPENIARWRAEHPEYQRPTDRRCLGGCGTSLTGRRKKCEDCKRRDRDLLAVS